MPVGGKYAGLDWIVYLFFLSFKPIRVKYINSNWLDISSASLMVSHEIIYFKSGKGVNRIFRHLGNPYYS